MFEAETVGPCLVWKLKWGALALMSMIFFIKVNRANLLLFNFTKKAVRIIPVGNYMFKVNNRNTRTRCEICSMLTIKTPERTF